jgi:hypothetical protein
MRRAYGTQLIFLTYFRRIEIRRYKMNRPEGTFIFFNRTDWINPPLQKAENHFHFSINVCF